MSSNNSPTVPQMPAAKRNFRSTSKHPTLQFKMPVEVEEEKIGRYCIVNPREGV